MPPSGYHVHLAGKVRRREGDRRTNLFGVAFEAVIGDDQERGAIVHAGLVDRGHHLFDAAIQKRDGAGGGQALGTERMVDGIQREEVQQHQVGPVFADQIDGGPGPDLVAKQDVRLREVLHVGGGDRALADHFLFQGSGGRRPFVERPGDGGRVVDGDPIDLRRGESGVVGGVVDRRYVDHLHLVDHGIDLDGRPCASRYQAAVDQESVLVGAHAGDESGVIGPGDRGIDGGHARSDALPDEAAQGGYGQPGVVQGVGGKAVQTDHDHHALLRRRLGGRGRAECDAHRERQRHRDMQILIPY